MRSIFIIVCLSITIVACNNTQTAPMPENTPKNNAVIEQYFQNFNAHNWQKMADMYIDTPTLKDPAYGIAPVQMTKTEIVKKYSELHQMIPDVHDSVIAMYNAGSNITVEFISSGTGPDNKKFKLPICTIFEIKNGLITKDFTYYDNF